MSPQIEIQIIALFVAVSCVLPGIFLVLGNKAMISDAITHTILLGIVSAFFVTKDLSSPFLLVGAATMGIITVWLTEWIGQSRLVSEDASIGIIFPFLFSIAIILITRYAGSVHLDTDSVLLGELAFAPFERLIVGNSDIGAKAIYVNGVLLLLDLLFVSIFFKELKLSTFDAVFCAVAGFSPVPIHYMLMSLVSITAVGAFQAVGSVLTVALMVGPPATAYLLFDDLKKILVASAGIAIANVLVGYRIAMRLDVSIAGSIATMVGISFLIVFVFGGERGLLSVLRKKRIRRIRFAKFAMLLHLMNHEGKPDELCELQLSTIKEHMNWSRRFTDRIIRLLLKENHIEIRGDILCLTEKGRRDGLLEYQSIFGLTP